jgi:hypothetical protein
MLHDLPLAQTQQVSALKSQHHLQQTTHKLDAAKQKLNPKTNLYIFNLSTNLVSFVQKRGTQPLEKKNH